jgi:class 3 adenylate cyclase/CheY-like chemotaxis protein
LSDAEKILVVDDTPMNVRVLEDLLTAKGYQVETASSGPEALEKVEQWRPDMVLLDVVMPGMSGYEVCRQIRKDAAMRILPVVMVTALDPGEERIKGLEAGADDFLTKPVNQPELVARVRSLLRIKSLYDQVQAQAAKLSEWSATLETRIEEQVAQLDRLSRLRRFLSPQVADLIVEAGDDSVLQSHRCEIATLFCDLRGFTAFSETGEPEEVMEVLQRYHETMGRLIYEHDGAIDHRAGDGIMIIFNDPIPCDEPALRAVRLALAMRLAMRPLTEEWRKLGHDLGFGVGVSLGYATLGMVGFEGRYDYTANGSAVNLAARLCDEARDGQILISGRAYATLDGAIEVEPLGSLDLKGFHRPIEAHSVVSFTDAEPGECN